MGIRVLFLYPNTYGMNMVPPAIAFLSALLKQKGHEVELFDSTYYDVSYGVNSEGLKAERLNVVPFDMDARGIHMKSTDWSKDLTDQVNRFSPDLIAISSTEDMWELAVKLLVPLKGYVVSNNTPVIVGGVFPTFAPSLVLEHPLINIVCIGEGENSLIDLCEKIYQGESYDSVTNLWVKKNNAVIKKNSISRAVDINNNPRIDLSLFDEERLYRPMAGRIYKMFPIETHRGCPFTCTFCNSPDQMKLYDREAGGGFFRKKKMSLVYDELKYLKDSLGCEYNYFWADTFLALNNREFDEFCEIYSDIKLPFWMQTRPETISDYKIRRLAEVGLHRISFGIEHGNEKFRRELLDRRWKNEDIINALKIPHTYGIQFSLNNITGFPGETRDLAMDTVELNRRIKDADNANIYSFVPFHGTPLRKLCESKGLVDRNAIAKSLTDKPMLDMPQYTAKEIEGLKKCFILYVKFPKNRWREIQQAEGESLEAEKIYSDLKAEFMDKYFVPPKDNPKAEFPAAADLEYGLANPN
jgi:radical SAM superfamily enzyme YgiQ (UPF0313 family)